MTCIIILIVHSTIKRCEIGFLITVCFLCRFIERKSLSSFSSGLICDIVGVVMFVSRDNRERKASRSSFWASKWVHLKDGKENNIFPHCLSYLLATLSYIYIRTRA